DLLIFGITMLPFATSRLPFPSADDLWASTAAAIKASISELRAERKAAQKKQRENARKRLIKRSKQHAQQSPTEPSLPMATPANLHVKELGNIRVQGNMEHARCRKSCVVTIKSTFTYRSNVNMMLMEKWAIQMIELAVPDIVVLALWIDWKKRKKA
ncbi:MAG: hypothetical protein LQ342_008561, partial [Letrouitia transgressa]